LRSGRRRARWSPHGCTCRSWPSGVARSPEAPRYWGGRCYPTCPRVCASIPAPRSRSGAPPGWDRSPWKTWARAHPSAGEGSYPCPDCLSRRGSGCRRTGRSGAAIPGPADAACLRVRQRGCRPLPRFLSEEVSCDTRSLLGSDALSIRASVQVRSHPDGQTGNGAVRKATGKAQGAATITPNKNRLYGGRDMEQAARPDAAVLEGLSKTQKPGVMLRIG
jgi:hypothetical protein